MDDRRNSILDAALDMVTRYGFRRTSMDDIAGAAGISRPALYQYFKGKDDLFASCVDHVIEQAFETAEQAMQTHQQSPERLAAYLSAYMKFYHQLLVAGPHGAELLTHNARLGEEKTRRAHIRLTQQINAIIGHKPGDETGPILAAACEGLKFKAPNQKTLERRIGMLVHRWLDGT